MKTLLTILTIMILSFQMIAQDIWFIHPSNGEILNDNFSETQVAVNISYNQELSLSYYYVKLITHNETYNSRVNGIPQWLYLSAGSYTWKLELWEGNELGQEFKTAEETITFHVKFKLFVKNNFGSGSIKIDGNNLSSGSSKLKFIGDNLTVGAIDQYYNNYERVWNSSGTNNSIWGRQGKGSASPQDILGATPRNYDYEVVSNDNYATIQANMKKVCNISFSNQLNGTTEGGKVTVNDTLRDAPTAQFKVVEQNLITASVETHQYFNNINYIFNKWDDNVTSTGRSIYPSSHKQYTAIYKGYPIFEDPMRGLVISGVREGKEYYIKLDWNEHPNS